MVKLEFKPKQSGFRGHSLTHFALLFGRNHLNKRDKRKCIDVFPIHTVYIEPVYLVSVIREQKGEKNETVAVSLAQSSSLLIFRTATTRNDLRI